jgi:hypothetical protein
MRPGFFPTLALAIFVLVFTAGCHQRNNHPPRVSVPVPVDGSGNITVRYAILEDQNKQLAAVKIEYSIDGGLTWWTATEAAGTLATPIVTGDGDDQFSDWRFSGIRPGFNLEEENRLYVTLSDSAGNRSITLYRDESRTISVAEGWINGNGTAAFSGPQISGSVELSYVQDDADVALEFAVSDGTVLLTASKFGVEHIFVWDSLRDLGFVIKTGVVLRITASDGDKGTAVASMPFTVDNSLSTAPNVSNITLHGTGGNIVVAYLLSDAESNPSDVTVQYATDNATYFAATEATQAGGDGTKRLKTEPAGVMHYFVWDSRKDLGEVRNESVTIRIRPADGGLGGPDCTSSVFTVENRIGEFQDATLTNMPFFAGGSYKCATGDFDNDGDVDVFVGNNGENMLYVNDGSAFFTLQRMWIRQSTSDVVVGDFTNDGLPDVFCCNKEENTLYINGPAGTLMAIIVGPPLPTLAGAAIDAQNDGILDIVTANQAGIAVQLGYGDGTFWHQLLPGLGYGLATADFNTDGISDFFIATDGKNGGYIHDGSFHWYNFQGNLPGIYDLSFGVVADDFDNDGDPDLYVANKGHNAYLENRGGNGLFPGKFAYQPYASGEAMLSADVTMLDIEGDGDKDLFVANDLGSNDLLINVDGRFFSASPVNLVDFGARSYGACAADFNGDGEDDIFVANNGQNQLYLGVAK